jgi:N-acetylmuramoyl-L-alanine amidase
MFCIGPAVNRSALGGEPRGWKIAIAITLLAGGALFAPAPAPAQVPVVGSPPTSPTAFPTVSGGRIVRPTLQLGSQGESVRELQAMLMLLGYYPGPVTGIYQEDTAAATRRFQSAAGVTADGIVGPATWSRLFPTPPGEANPPTATIPPVTTPAATPAATAPPATPPTTTPSPATRPPATRPPATTALPVLRLGMEGDEVRQLQQRLRSKGFYRGAIDGIFGSQTEAAVREIQSANNLTVDGIVGPATWRVIN